MFSTTFDANSEEDEAENVFKQQKSQSAKIKQRNRNVREKMQLQNYANREKWHEKYLFTTHKKKKEKEKQINQNHLAFQGFHTKVFFKIKPQLAGCLKLNWGFLTVKLRKHFRFK